MFRKRSELPTVPPAFDVVKYAKASDERMSDVVAAADDDDHRQPWSEVRLLARSQASVRDTDELWALRMAGAPFVAIARKQLMQLPLGHREGFLLSRMDGAIDLETLIEVSAMPRGETLRLVRDLVEQGVVDFR